MTRHTSRHGDVPFPLSFLLRVNEVPPGGKSVDLVADAAQRAAFVERYDLEALRALRATLCVMPWRQAGLRVEGRLKANGDQRCVMTLGPVPMSIDIAINRCFLPSAVSCGNLRDLAVEIDPNGEDPPDLLEGGSVDLGALVCEEFLLALDPFPRLPSALATRARFADAAEMEKSERPSPFRILERLRHKHKTDGS